MGRLTEDRRHAVQKKIRQIAAAPDHFDFLRQTDRMQKARVGKYRVFFRVAGNSIGFLDVRKRDIAYGR